SGVNAYPVDENSAVITFLTWPGPYYLFNASNNPVLNIEIFYGKSSSSLSKSIRTEYGSWGIVLRKLDPNTKYYYKLDVNFRNFSKVTSPIYSFITNRKQNDPIPLKLLCDFGQKNKEVPDGIIDFEDLVWFTIYWNAYQSNQGDLRGDIAGAINTTSGQSPDLITQPDGKVDFEDLMIFTQMWNWYWRKG
ncbi:MAG: GC-type dockerin domain-anchored protein, partial [Candidatus Desantisbacteria bacterium]